MTLERLARKDLRWWSVAGREEAAHALAQVWASRSGAPAGAAVPWPRPHGISDLLVVLAADVQRAGQPLECFELAALADLL